MNPRFAKIALVATGVSALLMTVAVADESHYAGRSTYVAPKVTDPIHIDGVADEASWKQASWQELTHRWLGPEYTADDFQGRYKVVWSEKKLYILGEFSDDVLLDIHRDPLVQYWDA